MKPSTVLQLYSVNYSRIVSAIERATISFCQLPRMLDLFAASVRPRVGGRRIIVIPLSSGGEGGIGIPVI